MKNWYHKLHSDEINKSSHQKSPKIAKIATWRNFEKVDFGKNAAKSSLMMFHTTFVRKKSEMFMQMSISMSTPILPHCALPLRHSALLLQNANKTKTDFEGRRSARVNLIAKA